MLFLAGKPQNLLFHAQNLASIQGGAPFKIFHPLRVAKRGQRAKLSNTHRLPNFGSILSAGQSRRFLLGAQEDFSADVWPYKQPLDGSLVEQWLY